MESKKETIKYFLEQGFLLSPDSIEFIDKNTSLPNPALYINPDVLNLLIDDKDVIWREFEKSKALSEKKANPKAYSEFLSYFQSKEKEHTGLKVLSSHVEVSEKREVRDFTLYFNSRLSALQKILYSREELHGTTSINRIKTKKDRENVSLIGLVLEKRYTKNKNLMLTLEDTTGDIKVLVNSNKPDLFNQAKDIVLDEVLGISGVNGDNIVFANNILWPDIPLTHELKKSDEEGYALFLSDLHVGSNNFLEHDFNRFLAWLNQKAGNNKQKELASKVKYIFVVGDLVDGVGIYPGQEEELTITDINEQYAKCVDFLSQIPKHIKLIICGGNHDALRIAEPQPSLSNEFCSSLQQLSNAVLVSNPSIVNIHSSDNFSGYNVLLYHGYSFDHYIANVDSIRNNGGYDRADLVMKFLLKRRHLAPTHASTLYVPYTDKDPLVISEVPDIFVTGHIHKSSIAHYKNITLVSGSCWQAKTAFQEKVGHNPEPSRVPIINLSTREVKILRFGK